MIDFDAERVAFEAWCSLMSDFPIERHPKGTGHWSEKYVNVKVEYCWDAWLARATLPLQTSG